LFTQKAAATGTPPL